MKKSLIFKALMLFSIISTISFAHTDEQKEGMSKDSTMSCGAGKCGSAMMNKSSMPMENEDDMMMKKSGNKESTMSCGAGKCGSSMMKKSSMPIENEDDMMMKKSGNKESTMKCGAGMSKGGSCGAGKCGNMKNSSTSMNNEVGSMKEKANK